MKDSEALKEALAVWGETLAEVRAAPAALIAPGADGDVHRLAPPLEVQSLAQLEELLLAVMCAEVGKRQAMVGTDLRRRMTDALGL
jgi:hypothetical protein